MKKKSWLDAVENSVGQIKKRLSGLFCQANIATHSLDADLIISHITGIAREKILAYPDTPITDIQLQKMDALVEKRLRYYPMAYLLGFKEFYGLRFKVNEHVLIPRPETEHLVECVLKRAHNITSLLDICTGTGCIGITIKKMAPHINVTLSDISSEALKIAMENAETILGKNQVTVVQSDLFQNIKGKFDAITANPPYISEDEYSGLTPDVHWEPDLALKAGDGLDFYRRISSEINTNISPAGWIFYEIGDKQKKPVVEINTANHYIFQECVTDYSGKDRIVIFSAA